jgi:hypothetical protein
VYIFHHFAKKDIFMKEDNSHGKIIIVAINLIILIVYTIYLRVSERNELDILTEAIFIGFHIIVCGIISIFAYRKEFLLSDLVILLIGFSSCWVVFTHY